MNSTPNQEKSTEQRRDTSVLVGGVSGRAGSPRRLASVCSSSPVGDQAGAMVRKEPITGKVDDTARKKVESTEVKKLSETVFFGKGTTTRRTPPPKLSEQTINGGTVEITQEPCKEIMTPGNGKKKREDSSEDEAQEETPKRPRGETEEERLEADMRVLIKKLAAAARKMKELVNKHSNTQKDVRGAVIENEYLATSLLKKTQKWEGLVIKPQQKPRTAETGIQTEGVVNEAEGRKAITAGEEAEIVKVALEKETRTYDEFTKVVGLRWPKTIFKRVTDSTEDIMSISWEWDLAQITSGDFRSEGAVAMQLKSRHQGVEELLTQGVQVGGVAYLIEDTRFPAGDGTFKRKSRFVYNLVAAKECMDPLDKGDVYNSIVALREVMCREGRGKVAIAGDRIREDILAKLMEFVFAGTEVEVLLMRRTKGRLPVADGGKATPNKRAARRGRDEAIIVKAGEKQTYAELLRNVRSSVDLARTGAEVSSVRKTRDGDLLLAVRKKDGKDHLEDLKKEIQAKIAGAQVLKRQEKARIVHVNGLDGAATAEELKAAIGEALPQNKRDFVIKALWTAYGETQNASVAMSEGAAEILLRKGRIKVGWSMCRIRERIEVGSCYRCWETGHIRVNCKGPDRSKLCHRCGKEGHIAKGCKVEPHCPICNANGHRANSTGCPVFRRVLDKRKH